MHALQVYVVAKMEAVWHCTGMLDITLLQRPHSAAGGGELSVIVSAQTPIPPV